MNFKENRCKYMFSLRRWETQNFFFIDFLLFLIFGAFPENTHFLLKVSIFSCKYAGVPLIIISRPPPLALKPALISRPPPLNKPAPPDLNCRPPGADY